MNLNLTSPVAAGNYYDFNITPPPPAHPALTEVKETYIDVDQVKNVSELRELLNRVLWNAAVYVDSSRRLCIRSEKNK